MTVSVSRCAAILALENLAQMQQTAFARN